MCGSVSCDISMDEVYRASHFSSSRLTLVSSSMFMKPSLRSLIICTNRTRTEQRTQLMRVVMVTAACVSLPATDQKYNWLTPSKHLFTGAVASRIVVEWVRACSVPSQKHCYSINLFRVKESRCSASTIPYSEGWKRGMLMHLRHINNCSISKFVKVVWVFNLRCFWTIKSIERQDCRHVNGFTNPPHCQSYPDMGEFSHSP